MRTIFFTTIMATVLITVISCKSKEQKDAEDYKNKIEKTVNENSPEKNDDQSKANVLSPNIPQGMESLVGEWELVKFISDRNGNSKIDPEEEKEGKLEAPDFLNLKADGGCEYSPVKVPARFVIEIQDDGSKKLAIYDPTGPEVNFGRYVMSVTDKELVLYRVKDSFEIFRRL